MVTLFRLISYLEGVSYVLLLFATAIKYLLNNEYWVKVLGMPHGILFLIYVFTAIFLGFKLIAAIAKSAVPVAISSIFSGLLSIK